MVYLYLFLLYRMHFTEKCSLNIYLKSPLCSIEEEQTIIIHVWTIMMSIVFINTTDMSEITANKNKLVQDLTLSNGQMSVSLYVEFIDTSVATR